jgi:hypothetical protein
MLQWQHWPHPQPRQIAIRPSSNALDVDAARLAATVFVSLSHFAVVLRMGEVFYQVVFVSTKKKVQDGAFFFLWILNRR